MRVEPVFRSAPSEAGMYESFYLRAVSPHEPLGVWIRHTVHKRPGRAPTGACGAPSSTRARGAPAMHKATFEELRVPPGGWIEIGGRTAIGSRGGAGRMRAGAVVARASRRSRPELRHLRPALLYRTPLPRTKLTSPAPLARFDGVLELERPSARSSSPAGTGMVGHNWGTEHAARWIWMHGCDFPGAPGAWLDLAVGRVQVGSRLTPWIANGAISFDGATRRLAGRPVVTEDPWSARARASRGGRAEREGECRRSRPRASRAGATRTPAWPARPERDRRRARRRELLGRGAGARCLPPRGGWAPVLRSAHGGAYELGMGEHDHGVPLAPFADG